MLRKSCASRRNDTTVCSCTGRSTPIEATKQPASATPTKSTAKTKNAKGENRSIRVQLEKIERLMNMFEESVIERGRIDELAQAIQNKN